MSDFNSLVQYTVENISRPIKYIIYKLTEFIRVVDKFVYRQVPTGAASGYATIEQIEGNTVKFNQLIKITDNRSSIIGFTFTRLSKTKVRFVGTGNTGDSYLTNTFTSSVISGHKYLFSTNTTGATTSNITFHIGTRYTTVRNNSKWIQTGGSSTFYLCVNCVAAFTESTTFEIECNSIDLTAIFGSGNEPSTVADFEAWLAQNGLPSVADYNAGELLSVKMSGMQTNTSKLPLGYQELEYLESTGTQYIDTGIVTASINHVIGTVAFLGFSSNSRYVVGGRIGSTSSSTAVGYALYSSSHNGFTFYPMNWYDDAAININIGQILSFDTIIKDGLQVFTVDGIERFRGNETLEVGSGSNTIHFFSARGTQYASTARIYKVTLYNDSTKLGDFIPAKRLSDNVLGMYDTVSNTFFTNSGTGTFIGGPEVHLDTLPFDVTTITGINPNTNTREVMFSSGMKQADRAGTVKDTLDLLSDTAMVKCGIVDLGDGNWNYDSTYQLFSCRNLIYSKTKNTDKLLCIKYLPYTSSSLTMPDKTIGVFNANDALYVKDTAYTDPTVFKNAMNGVKLIYELATPITYTDLQDANGNPLNPRYKVEQGGTEQVLPANTSTPTTVAPTLTTTYTKDVH